MSEKTVIIRQKEIADFFKCFKAVNGKVSWLKGAVKLAGGIEATFVSEAAAKDFLAVVAGKEGWDIESALSDTILVTLAPRGQGGHVLMPDATLIAYLSRYGEVLEGKRLVYAQFPSVENGLRQFKVKPKGGAPIPSIVSFGRTSFFVSHRGQVKTCIKCSRAGHMAKECTVTICHKCGEEGHTIKVCTKPVRCTVCLDEGHTFRVCPKSYSNSVKLTSRFSKVAQITEKVTSVESQITTSPNTHSSTAAVSELDSGEVESVPESQLIESSQASEPPQASEPSQASDSQCIKAADLAEAPHSSSQDIFESQSDTAHYPPPPWTVVKSKGKKRTPASSSDESENSLKNLNTDEKIPGSRRRSERAQRKRTNDTNV